MIYTLDGIPKADTIDFEGKQLTIDLRGAPVGGGVGASSEEEEESPADEASE